MAADDNRHVVLLGSHGCWLVFYFSYDFKLLGDFDISAAAIVVFTYKILKKAAKI